MNSELKGRSTSEPAALEDGLPTPRRYVPVAAVSLGTVVTAIDSTIVNVALPTIARDLRVEPSEAVLIVTVYQLVLMMTLLPFSAFGQRIGFRFAYLSGLVVCVVATIMCFFAASLESLVAVRGLQALGAAAAASVSAAMIRSIYPLSSLGRGLSLNTVIAASAASFAPTVGGAVLAFANWPWLFAITAPFGLLAIVAGRRSLPAGQRRSEPFDVLGAAMCAATFGLVVFGLESAVHGESRSFAGAIIAMGFVVGFVFVRRELGQAQPVFPVDLLRLKNIALPCVGSMLAYLAMAIVMVALPFRLQQHFGFSPAAAGAVLAPMPLIAVFVAPASGLLSDRIPAGILGGIGMAIGFVGLLFIAFLPADANQFDVLWRMSICGFGFGMFFSPNARQIMAAAPSARAAAAGALFSTIRGAGQTLGATAIASLLAAGVGLGPIPPLIAAGLTLIACVCSFAVLKPAR